MNPLQSPNVGVGKNIPSRLSRVDRFYTYQIWVSPRGTCYKVICVAAGIATISKVSPAPNIGKNSKRPYDSVLNWTLIQDNK